MKNRDVKFLRGRGGKLLTDYLSGKIQCTSELKCLILEEIDLGFDEEFVRMFLDAVCTDNPTDSIVEYLSNRVYEGIAYFDEKLNFIFCPNFMLFRDYCLEFDVPLVSAMKTEVKRSGLSPKCFGEKYGYSFSEMIESYDSVFETSDIEDWITAADELMNFCDFFEIKAEPQARSPEEWDLSEADLESYLENRSKKEAKNFARLFSSPPDRWYGERYFHVMME